MSVGHIGQLCLYIKSHKALLTLTYSLTHVSVTERKRERSDTHTPHGDKLSKAEVMKELSTDWKFDKCVFMPMWCVCVCV